MLCAAGSTAPNLPGAVATPAGGTQQETFTLDELERRQTMALTVDPDAPIRKVAVRGSRFLHVARDGHATTLCGRQPTYLGRMVPPRPMCDRCRHEAINRGLAMPR